MFAFLRNMFREVRIEQRHLFFLVILGLLALQVAMSFFQVRRYQKTIKAWLGKGVLGVGQRKGFIRPGELLILVYNRHEDRALSVQSMRGFTIFAAFREVKEYAGLSLQELRRRGIEQDAIDMKWYRKRHPYDPAVLSKKKGALIQAVEAVEGYLRREAEREEAEKEE